MVNARFAMGWDPNINAVALSWVEREKHMHIYLELINI
jgi:hypothetical protein